MQPRAGTGGSLLWGRVQVGMCQLLRQDEGCTAALRAVFPAFGRVRSAFGSEVELGYTISIMGLLNSSKAIGKVVGWIDAAWSTAPSGTVCRSIPTLTSVIK